ncbi:permease [Candidatus Dojkabacteria bacterium]|uniref:Permease n=1 Tax=Candidatus Dojkabacteria bacterium TaxID=2099670 RepID=A0A955L0M3_9BACT|nr:permease [Candidatus Dojkabacteria bacterium]
MSQVLSKQKQFLSGNLLWITLLLVLPVLYYHLGVGDFLTYSPEGVEISAKLGYMFTVVMGVILVALPFLVLGVSVSVVVTLFVREEWLLRHVPRGRFSSHLVVSLLGMLMPVCECGNVPVARRLLMKGFSVSQSVTFLLAAPVINVVTLWSTAEAFGKIDSGIVLLRILATFIIANAVGMLLSFKSDQNDFLTDSFIAEMCRRPLTGGTKWKVALETFRSEFIEVFKMLLLGAITVGLIRAFLPNEIILSIGSNPVLSVLAMIMFGYVISVCSSIDAFLALAFADRFTAGALVAFLISGPMVDIKIFSLLRASFKVKLLIIIFLLVTLASMVVGVGYNLVS